MDDEMREMLGRHGFTPEGVAAVEEFEAKARAAKAEAKKRKPAVVETLFDF